MPTTSASTTTETEPVPGTRTGRAEHAPAPTTGPDVPHGLQDAGPSDRGDVPGWVLVTLMTAGLVIALWAVAGPALTEVFSTAIDRVTSVG